jgi:hypothetical protein
MKGPGPPETPRKKEKSHEKISVKVGLRNHLLPVTAAEEGTWGQLKALMGSEASKILLELAARSQEEQ